jgi:hypothetical protein
MSLDIREEAPTPAALSEHAAIPIAFVVDRVLEVRLLDGGLSGMSLTQTASPTRTSRTTTPSKARGRSAGRDALTCRTGHSSAAAGTARASAVP